MPTTRKLTHRALSDFAKSAEPEAEIRDTDITGYHGRQRKRGLALRFYYRTADGKRRVATIGRFGDISSDAARGIAKDMAAEVAKGGDPNAAKEQARREREAAEQNTVGAYLEGPFRAYQDRRKDGHATLNRLRKHFAAWLDHPLHEFSRADVARWQADREAEGLAHATIKRTYSALQTLLNQAVRDGVIDRNPLQGIALDKPHAPAEGTAAEEEKDTGRRYLTQKEEASLLAGLEAYQAERRKQRRSSRAHGKPNLPDLDGLPYVDHVAPWILTMYYTGLRPGDINGLRWEHLALRFKRLRKVIEKTAHKVPEPTTLPLSDAAVDVLTAWWEQEGKPNQGPVFPGRKGGRLDKGALRKPWQKVKGHAGLPADLDLYTLRHNFASQLVMAGVDLMTVSRLMAHRDIQTTIRFYGHLAPDHALEAVNLFACRSAPGQGLEAAK
jgi:integrase